MMIFSTMAGAFMSVVVLASSGLLCLSETERAWAVALSGIGFIVTYAAGVVDEKT